MRGTADRGSGHTYLGAWRERYQWRKHRRAVEQNRQSVHEWAAWKAKIDFTSGCGRWSERDVRCATARWRATAQHTKGTRAGIVRSAHPGDAVNDGQRGAADTDVEDVDECEGRNEDECVIDRGFDRVRTDHISTCKYLSQRRREMKSMIIHPHESRPWNDPPIVKHINAVRGPSRWLLFPCLLNRLLYANEG